MKMKNVLGIALVGAIALLLCMATTSQAVFIESIADVFDSDFTDAGGTLPVTKAGLATPNGGAITFYANGDVQGTSSLIKAVAVIPGGFGSGWEDTGSIIGYARGGPFGIGPGTSDAIVAHGGDGATATPAEQKVDYTVPITGLYDLTVNLQQPFDPARSMRLQLFEGVREFIMSR